MTPRVREILNWYGSDNPGTKANLARLLGHGQLADTGRLVIFRRPRLQHGPARSFAPIRPAIIRSIILIELAVEAGCNAYAWRPSDSERRS